MSMGWSRMCGSMLK